MTDTTIQTRVEIHLIPGPQIARHRDLFRWLED